MSVSSLPVDCLDSIGFRRLHALVERGYRPRLGTARRDEGHVCIPLRHPRDGRRRQPPPAVTLWSDGIVSTGGLLWPDRQVPSDEPPPDWQRFILPQDDALFASFLDSVAPPGLVDLYLKPFLTHARIFSVRLIFGATLCMLLGLAVKLLLTAV